jgi:aspartyl-tRNA(Asn)/glutamyl-tRNA(Gln) amidotransferase subunit A
VHTIASASAALRRQEITAVSLVERAIENHARYGAETNAFITFTPERALDEARACDADAARGAWRGPLHGIPISIKDLIDVQGTSTTAASRVLPETPAARDAEVTRRLRAAGAVIIGKTNLHEFAFGTTSEDSAYGPVRHPLDPTRMAGGSSGGSAAAVATGIGLASVGTDTGGSIRIPSALCGLVGLKPAYGEVPVDGVVPLSTSFDHVGPITLTVDDARVMWEVMSGKNGVSGRGAIRIGVPRGYLFERLEDEVRAAFEAGVAALAGGGASVRDVEIPSAVETPAAYVPVVFHESWAWHKGHIARAPEGYTEAVRTRLEMGRDVDAAAYARAQAIGTRLREEVDTAMRDVDVLALPSMGVTAPALGTMEIAFGDRVEPVRAVMLRLTQLFDITGHPAITLPLPASGLLPIGLQLVGHTNATARLLADAARIEARAGIPPQGS